MCIAVVLIRPKHNWPIVLGAIREEQASRPWDPPQCWDPDYPGVIAPKDIMGQGTWLSVQPQRQTLVAILNRPFTLGPAAGKMSRGLLPLMATTKGWMLKYDVARQFQPFNLLRIESRCCRFWSWDGDELQSQNLGCGWHMLDVYGLDNPEQSYRQRYWLPAFRRAQPPQNITSDWQTAWGEWPQVIAKLCRRFLHDHQDRIEEMKNIVDDFGPLCAALIAFANDGSVRYDFCAQNPRNLAWYRVL